MIYLIPIALFGYGLWCYRRAQVLYFSLKPTHFPIIEADRSTYIYSVARGRSVTIPSTGSTAPTSRV